MPDPNSHLPSGVQDWLDKANDDELNAESIFKHQDGTASGVCFLAQQMAEKYLKAMILLKQKQLPKIHSLDRLLEICVADDMSLATLKDDAIYLTDFYVETRYPGNYNEFNWQDAKEALTAAKNIKQVCLEIIQ